MAYIQEYWTNKEKRAEQAKKWTKKMTDAFPDEIKKAIQSTTTYHWTHVFDKPQKVNPNMEITVCDMDSVGMVKNMAFLNDQTGKKVAVLNFASYKNPGGMFIKGSKAQEECLCHASFLYNVLKEKTEFYEWNRSNKNRALYIDRALYTPDVCFPDGLFDLRCDVITCAAPNKSAAQKYQNVTDEQNTKWLRERIKFVLNIAMEQKVDILILGAYGCGVFGQNPTEVAQIFKEYLTTTYRCFEKVIFAIPDGNNGNMREFGIVFAD